MSQLSRDDIESEAEEIYVPQVDVNVQLTET
jgi:hypothetical protein